MFLPIEQQHCAHGSRNLRAYGLAGCATTAGSSEPVWECIGHGVCGSAGQQVLYGWGKDAPAMSLPPGVGFHVGEGSAIHSLVLQVPAAHFD